MRVTKWVALLATGSMLAVAAPVSAQFGGLGALKKKLDTVAKELEKPKPAPQPQPQPQTEPTTKQVPAYRPTPATVNNAPNQSPPQSPYESQVPASKVLNLGSDFPRDIQVASGPMPAFIKSSLETVTSCNLATGTSEDGNPLVADHVKGFDFEMLYNSKTNSVNFGQFVYREYPGSDPRNPKWEESRSDFANAFEKIGVDSKVSKIELKYAGNDDVNYYFQLNMLSENKTFLINLLAEKEWMESAPVISGKFPDNWEITCDNPENNG